MTDITYLLLLFVTGSLAGFMNVMAGGGSTITLPVLLFIGLDSSMANGTNRVAIFVQNLAAIKSFSGSKYSNFKESGKLALCTLPGGLIGALIAVNISDSVFRTILAIVMIGIVISMVLPGNKKEYGEGEGTKAGWPVYLALFGTGFYGGFIQVGVGFILMAVLRYLMKLNLVYVNMHKVFIVFIYTIPALAIFIITDNVNWPLGLSLAAGNALGGWFAAKLSVKKGEGLIRKVLIVIVIIMSIKLLGGF